MTKRRNSVNIIITIAITIGSVLMGAFLFRVSYLRLWESCQDLWSAGRYYINAIFKLNNDVTATVTDYSSVIVWNIKLPDDLEGFLLKVGAYFVMLRSKGNIINWAIWSARTTVKALEIATVIIPVALILVILIKLIYNKNNMKNGTDTPALKLFKKVSKVTYQPIKGIVKSYYEFLHEHDWILWIWLVIWVLNLNLAPIVISLLAYYLYFAISFDFRHLYGQFCKLFMDLQVVIGSFPWWIIGLIAWIIFDKTRKAAGTAMLRHFENRNCGFINSLPIVSMTCGSMGKKKTTAITDMALSQEVMFREEAFRRLQTADLKFPYFPWLRFEKEILTAMGHRTVYNLATVKAFVAKKRKRFEKSYNAEKQLYGYDYKRYGLYYNDELKNNYLFDVLSTYAQLYFIYVIESSLIVSNYSIREDNSKINLGNFPIWNTDFFSDTKRDTNHHSHILDFDTIRLGKKVIDNNPFVGGFEFGVLVISEVGKERGNTLELKEVKKGTIEANQKNDLFNSWLKMCRHSATVDNFPFIKVFTDEQRPESWGADARDLCDIVTIISTGETRIAMPFYTIEEVLTEWFMDKFIKLYYNFRFKRGDNTLFIHILKSITAWLFQRDCRIKNKYGYAPILVNRESGTMDGKVFKQKYYIMHQKTYRQRFSTDCFSDYFNELGKNSRVGLDDFREYESERASVEELKLQHSYFIDSLYHDE